MEPTPDRAATPSGAIRAGGAAGLAGGGWIGLVDGARAAVLGPEPFSAPDLGRGVLAQAAAGALLGLAAGALLGRGGRRPAGEVRSAVLHGLAFLFAALLAAGHLLPRQRATSSLAINAVLLGIALLAAAAATRWSWRRRARAARPPRDAWSLAPLALGALALLLPPSPGVDPAPPSVRAQEGKRLPNVLVVLVDTLRADRVGACGSTLGLTPRVDAFARGAATFPRARTSSPWTKPAVASLLTGLRPERHGMQAMAAVLPEGAPLLLSHLDRAGYRTAMLSDSQWTSPAFGFRRGVNGPFLHPETGDLRGVTAWRTGAFVRDWWVDSYHVEHPATQRGAPALVSRLLEWTRNGDERPWAAYVHLMEPHHPYAPDACHPGPRPRVPVREFHGTLPYDRGEPLAADAHAALVANYDDEVREVDAAFGALVDGLPEESGGAGTIVVFTADHGEEFFEHGGWVHEHSLHDELLRVPLLLRAPGGRGAGRVSAADVTLEDVVPTVLELCGIATSARFDGRSLVPLLDGRGRAPRPSASLLRRSRAPILLRSAVLGDVKVIDCRKAGDERELWYDLAADPGERNPLPRPAPEVAAPLLEALRASEGLEALAADADARLTPETEAALRALGYLGTAPK